jgi:hypothetical protein
MGRFVTSRRNNYPVVHSSLPAFNFVPFEKRHHPWPGVVKYMQQHGYTEAGIHCSRFRSLSEVQEREPPIVESAVHANRLGFAVLEALHLAPTSTW